MTGRNLTINIRIEPEAKYNEETIQDKYSVPVPALEAYIIRSCKNADSYTINESKKNVTFTFNRRHSEEELTLYRDTSEDIINNIFNK